ncbi:MAG: site-specific integrase [Syntrophomonadaceae bacterium]|nr:site-specific integrase [Syntrophomonadaceae bacterium]
MAGSLRKRGKNSYELRVSAGTGPDGKRHRHIKTVKAKNKREAEKLLALFVAEVEKGEYVEPSRLTLKEFSQRWTRDYVDKGLAPATRKTYKDKLKNRVLPALGHLKLEEIKPLHLLDYFSNLEEDGMRLDGKPGGMGPDSIAQCYKVLSSIYKCAVEWQVVQHNPCENIKPPKIPKRELNCLDEEQTHTLLVALENEPMQYRTMVTMAALTGLRRGELLGLEWKHVDFEEKTARIVQVSQYVNGVGTITKEPKTTASKRLVALPTVLVELLKSHKAHQNERRLKLGEKWEESDRLFTTWNGQPMHPSTISKWFREFQDNLNKERKEAGLPELPRIRFHDLRHSAASIMITQGIDVGTVAKNLGHSRPSITTDIYFTALQTAQERAADKMNELFGNSIKK